MRKSLTFLLLIILSMGAFPAHGMMLAASDASARLEAMSADPEVVEDIDLIFTYPNKVLDYKNTVDYRLGNLGTTSDDWAGFLDGKSEQVGVLGVYLHRSDDTLFGGESFGSLADSELLSNDMNDWDNYLWNTYGNDYGYGDTYSEIVEEAINDTPTPKPLFDLFWGKRIGEAGVGVRVSYADSKDNHNSNADLSNLSGDVSSQQTVYFARQIGVLAGVGLSDIGPFQEMNLSLGYSFGMFEDSSISNSRQYPDQAKMDSWSIKDDGISALDVHMNLRHDLGENDQLKLYASGSVHSFGLKGYDNSIYDLTDTQVSADSRVGLKDKMTSGTIGLGLNHSVKSLNSVVSGGLKVTAARFSQEVSYLYDGQDIWQTLWTNGYTEWTRVTTHMTTLPAFVSVETGVLSWLTLRMGAQYDLFDQESLTYSNPYGSKTSVTHNNGGGINFSTGFGLRWKNWVLDGVLDTNDFENRIYNLQPGGGIHFNGTMVQLVKADLKYKF